jgi:signal transduction histidine kinase
VDPKNFHEVMVNILSNAIKYNREGGSVNITVEQKEKTLRIIIADTGIGIPEKDKEKIFTIFFRAGNALSQETDGTGLGLFMVKSYMERWGGKIWFESKEGQYTKYYLEFKIHD